MNSRFWYRLLESCARVTGPWLLTAFARLVAVGYFFFSPRKEAGLRFYGRLFPERSAAGRQLAVFLQYQRFTTIHSDRFRARCHNIDFTTFRLLPHPGPLRKLSECRNPTFVLIF